MNKTRRLRLKLKCRRVRGGLAVVSVFAFVVCNVACSTTKANAKLSDGNSLRVKGYGAASSVEIKCLRPEAIRQLTGGEIPDYAPKASCYTTMIVTSDSAAIAKAVTSYVNAERDLANLVQGAVPQGLGGPMVEAPSEIAKDALAAIVEDAAGGEGVEIEARAAGLKMRLSAAERAWVKDRLGEAGQALAAGLPTMAKRLSSIASTF